MGDVTPLHRGRRRRTGTPTSPPLVSLIDSWRLALSEANKSPDTIRLYTGAARKLCDYLADHELPTTVDEIEPAHIRAFLAAELERTSAGTAATHFRDLRVFFNWLVRERERTAPSPMDNVDRPTVPEKARTFFDDEDLRALLHVCEGADFVARRDTAILRILMDTGMRVSGLAGLRYHPADESRTDVFLTKRRLRIRLKGGDETWVPLGKKAAAALDRYIRMRARHHLAAESPWLWIGFRGKRQEHFGPHGIQMMIRNRGAQAGVQGAHPHRFRRTFADDYLEGGGTVDGLMAIAGWKSYDMVKVYAGERAAERARKMHDRLSPGDRI